MAARAASRDRTPVSTNHAGRTGMSAGVGPDRSPAPSHESHAAGTAAPTPLKSILKNGVTAPTAGVAFASPGLDGGGDAHRSATGSSGTPSTMTSLQPRRAGATPLRDRGAAGMMASPPRGGHTRMGALLQAQSHASGSSSVASSSHPMSMAHTQDASGSTTVDGASRSASRARPQARLRAAVAAVMASRTPPASTRTPALASPPGVRSYTPGGAARAAARARVYGTATSTTAIAADDVHITDMLPAVQPPPPLAPTTPHAAADAHVDDDESVVVDAAPIVQELDAEAQHPSPRVSIDDMYDDFTLDSDTFTRTRSPSPLPQLQPPPQAQFTPVRPAAPPAAASHYAIQDENAHPDVHYDHALRDRFTRVCDDMDTPEAPHAVMAAVASPASGLRNRRTPGGTPAQQPHVMRTPMTASRTPALMEVSLNRQLPSSAMQGKEPIPRVSDISHVATHASTTDAVRDDAPLDAVHAAAGALKDRDEAEVSVCGNASADAHSTAHARVDVHLAALEAPSVAPTRGRYRPSHAENEDVYDFAIIVRATADVNTHSRALTAAHAYNRTYGGAHPDDEQTVAPAHVLAAAAAPVVYEHRQAMSRQQHAHGSDDDDEEDDDDDSLAHAYADVAAAQSRGNSDAHELVDDDMSVSTHTHTDSDDDTHSDAGGQTESRRSSLLERVIHTFTRPSMDVPAPRGAAATHPRRRVTWSQLPAVAEPAQAAAIAATTPATAQPSSMDAHDTTVPLHVRVCAEVCAALRRAGLKSKRVRSLSRRVWLIKIYAPEWRLELEAEKLRLRMRRLDGGWSRFKRSMREAFMPAHMMDLTSHVGQKDSSAARGKAGALARTHTWEDELMSDRGLTGVHADVEQGDARRRGGDGGARPRNASLFHSSDRQTLIDHIIRSSAREGGADLGAHTHMGVFIEHMFPLHMYVRLHELRNDWLSVWRPPRSMAAWDRIGVVDDNVYAEPLLVPLTSQLDAGGTAPSLPMTAVAGGVGSSMKTPLARTQAWMKESMRALHTMSEAPRSDRPRQCGCIRAICSGLCKGRRSCARCCSGLCTQPLDRIAAYYGETVAFYFAFLQFYTHWLIPPAAVGVCVFAVQVVSGSLDSVYVPAFSLCMALWSIAFLEVWKRRNAYLAQRWGVPNYEDEETVRPQFTGEWVQDVRNGAVMRVYPTWKRAVKCAVTLPIMVAFVAGIVIFMILVFSTRDRLLARVEAYGLAVDVRDEFIASFNGSIPNNVTIPPPPVLTLNVAQCITDAWTGGFTGFFAGSAASSDSVAAIPAASNSNGGSSTTTISLNALRQGLSNLEVFFYKKREMRWWFAMTVPPLVYGCMMPLFDLIFNRLALAFNDWENHTTESQYRNHRIAKVFFYRFVACFVSLFYYAFSPSHSREALFVQLAAFLIAGQLFNNIFKLAAASVLKCIRECRFMRHVHHAEESGLGEGRRGGRVLRHAQSTAWLEARMPVYDTFHDYAELLIQYGYVTFFSWAFPLAPLCALINNAVVMRTDAYRLCYLTQRPIAHKAGGIGVWYNVLVSMSLLAVLTNCAHLALSSKQFAYYFPGLTDAQRLLVVFIFEHLVLSLRVLIGYIIPAVPAAVKRRAQRDAFALAKLQGRRSIGSVAT